MSGFLRLHEGDNVAVALRLAPRGTELAPGVTTLDEVAMAHKVALCDIPNGAAVIKYGVRIGVATADIPAGAHVHVHNIASLYTASIYRAEDAGLAHG